MTLDEYLWRNKLHHVDFAKNIGCTPSMVSWVRRGERRPSIGLAQKIELATKGEVTAIALLGLDKKPKAAPKHKKASK